MDLLKIKQIIFDELAEKSSHNWKEKGNKYHHGERVAKLILTLRNYIIPDDDGHDDILTVAAWFHDIMNGTDNHALLGAERTKELLSGYCSDYEMREIYDIIYRHDDRYSDRESFSVYARLHQDADLLDHFGTFDIWTQFLYAVCHGQTILEEIKYMNEWRSELDTKYGGELNFEISKKIYDEKTEFYNYFADRFSVEGTGGIWNEKELLGN